MQPRDVNQSFEAYYDVADYWNALDCTNRMFNRRISGDETISWWRHFARRTGEVFDRALILNCGNGWVEREMLDAGFIKEAVGIDLSDSLLNEAREAAGDRPVRYTKMDINTEALPADCGPFDLVVNHAAAHHVTRLDRVFRNICTLLPDDGWFISFDYVGPHRNQYSADAWDEAWRLNKALPDHVRQSMAYPLLDLFIEIDPSEAVHSELIVETLRRYFHVAEIVPLGGALAYPVLTHNANLFAATVDPGEREHWGQFVLDRDAEYLTDNPQSTLFAYFSARPNRDVLSDHEALASWAEAEDAREARATERGGKYYEPSMLNEVYWALAVNERSNRELQRELQAIRGSYLYSHLTRILQVPAARRVLQSRFVRSLRESRLPSD